MRYSKRFLPSVMSLEGRQLLSVTPGRQKLHKPVHVVAHAEKAPHQGRHTYHTGTFIGGEVACQRSAESQSTAAVTYGSGRIRIGTTTYQNAGFSYSTDGTLAICADGDFIFATCVTLEDGSVGNYKITGGTGDLADVRGTGTFFVDRNVDGSYTVAINPHQ